MIISDLTYFEDASEARSIVGGTTKKDDKKYDKKNVKKIAVKIQQKTGDVNVKFEAGKKSDSEVTAISGDNTAVVTIAR